MLNQQEKLILSPYLALYDQLIPKDHFLRLLNEQVDFSFVESELRDHYCLNNGRNATPPIQMFKYLLLKSISSLSDVNLVERCRYDLSYKYFLGLAPEDNVIHPSSLTKFRKLRLKDENLLDLLIEKSVQFALQKGVLKSKTIYMDATHISSRYRFYSKGDLLLERARKLRHQVYSTDSQMKDKFPPRPKTHEIEDTIAYCNRIVEIVREQKWLSQIPAVNEPMNYLEEGIEDVTELQTSYDEEARIGYKKKREFFHGYKLHMAMADERIITAAVLTSGNEIDAPKLKELVDKSKRFGMKVSRVVGDSAYGTGVNLRYCMGNENESEESPNREAIELIAPLRGNETHETHAKTGFEYNKDAGMYQCPGGHLSITKKRNKSRVNQKGYKISATETYYFDTEKCKTCRQKEGCYNEKSKTRSYSVSIKDQVHKEQAEKQKSKEFRELYQKRYKIEAKNNEIKNVYQCASTQSAGLFALEIQSATAIFISNIKRIMKLEKEKAR